MLDCISRNVNNSRAMKNYGKIFFALSLAVFFFGISIYAQQDVRIRRGQFRKGSEGFRDAWKAIKTADDQYRLGKGMYRQARDKYMIALNYNPANAELNYKIGVCYLLTDDKYQAINYLKQAYQMKPRVAGDIHYLLGRANHLILNFDTAIAEYKKHIVAVKRKERKNVIPVIARLIEECENGKLLVTNPQRVIITNLGSSINSEYDDYGSVFSTNDSLLFFTSRRPFGKKPKLNPYDNKFYEDIYLSTKNDGKWKMAERMGNNVNSKGDEAAVGLMSGNEILVVYRGRRNGGDLYQSEYDDRRNKWTHPMEAPAKFRSKYQETSMSISSDSSTFYFVSNNPKNSQGGKDIFSSTLKKKGTERWRRAVNIGVPVNTPYNEECVYISPDNKSLYFSSKGHNTMGGYDIFKSTKDQNGSWSEPENLGYPINTPDDELFFVIDPVNPKYAYYSAIREGGTGGRDIYRIAYLGSEKDLVLATDTQLVAWKTAFPPSIFFSRPEPVTIDSTYVLKGRVTDAKTKQGLVSKIELIDVAKNQTIGTAVSDTSGSYRFNIPAKSNYGAEIMAKDYLFFLEVFDLSKDPSELVITRDFALTKVEVGTKVVMKNIFFETSKATMKPESYAELENVIKFLQDNPTMRLEISGHTDNVGSRNLNQKLSENRAKAVVDYLVGKGIDKTRLEAKGYADTQPVTGNNTPEGRSQNRRVEFKVLGL
jgi:outer membrane protein OmpA-like peptidoglycan-associated protein